MQTLVVKKNLWVLKSLELLWRSCLALREERTTNGEVTWLGKTTYRLKYEVS